MYPLDEELMKILEEFIAEEDELYCNGNFPRNGFLVALFLKKDPRLCDSAFPYIRKMHASSHFQNHIKKLYHCELNDELYGQKGRIQKNPDDGIAISRIERLNEEITFLSTHALSDILEKYRQEYSCCYMYLSDSSFLIENFEYFKILDLLINSQKREMKELEIEAVYEEKGINLKEVDKQFSKYRLVTIDDHFRFIDSVDIFAYDKRINKCFRIDNLDKDLMRLFIKMRDSSYINSISLRLNGTSVQDGDAPISILNEEVEFGRIFSFSDLKNSIISKLYSHKYDDNLWINIDGRNITFEETLDDFCITADDEIKTQVIHMEYILNGDNAVISHLDHEYIYYSFEEYENRKIDYRQKGNARRREKTFKIDDSEIPFYAYSDQLVLYNVLMSFFKNTDLINEYFSNFITLPNVEVPCID